MAELIKAVVFEGIYLSNGQVLMFQSVSVSVRLQCGGFFIREQDRSLVSEMMSQIENISKLSHELEAT